MDATAGSLITTFDYVWARLTGRLTGLTDEEYFWEPVAGCWSLRQDDDGIALGVQDQLLLGRQRYEAHVDYF